MVTEEHIAEIIRLGTARMPEEACGVIVGRKVLQVQNYSEEPHNSYVMHGSEVVKTLEELGFESGQIVIWHTHPSGFIGPSKGDLEMRIEGVNYLVVSLPNGEAVQY